MKIYAPEYYKKFKCIADRCQNSCCIGWDIYIDDETLEKYVSGEDEIIKNSIEDSEDGARFIMGNDKRCPHLLSSGLCDMICRKGEGYLCEICREHPRFYNTFTDHIEAGLGLCCEEAARIILSETGNTELVYVDSDDSAEYASYPEEKELLDKRDRLIEILQIRDLSIEDRIEKAVDELDIFFDTDHLYANSPTRWAVILKGLERLDPSWDDYLSDLLQYGNYDPIPSLDIPLEKLLIYFIYRHASGSIGEIDFSDYCHFAFVSYRVIKAMCNARIEKYGSIDFSVFADICRRFSAEIEYSDENMDFIHK